MTGDPGSRRSTSQKTSPRLNVAVVDAAGRPVRGPLAAGLGSWLAGLTPARVAGRVTVALVSDARVRALNRTYRGKDYATDVLSFPVEVASAEPIPSPRSTAVRNSHLSKELGDIVIATGVAARQAKQAGHSPRTEVRVLALHGLLHLLGYDHENPADAGSMLRIERQWRKKGGLPSGLIDRSRS